MDRRRRYDRTLGIALGLVALAGAARAEEGQKTIQTSRGVRIDLRFDPARASDEEILAALEEAARNLRRPPPLPDVPVAAAEAAVTPPPDVFPAPDAAPAPIDGLFALPCGDLLVTGGPHTLLWRPPLANQREPRMALKMTSLENDTTTSTIDTAVGATFPVFRFGWADGGGGRLQQDVFAVVFSRFRRNSELVATDFRFGVPLTYARGPWHAKLAYEHTSTHDGDDNLLRSGRPREQLVRDDLVVGLGRYFGERWRVYGQAGYAMSMSAEKEEPFRYDWGVEWQGRSPTGFVGRPFAAFDMDLRGEQGYEPNVTAQVGWYWGQPGGRLSACRLALEFYDGKSPFGGFLQTREQWYGFNVSVDY